MTSAEATSRDRSPLFGTEEFLFPVSSSQERLWFFEQLFPGSSAFNLPIPFRIEGPLQLEAITKAFDTLVERHESLRTTFTQQEGQPKQVVHSHHRADVEILDLTSVAVAERDSQARLMLEKEARRPFDLTQGPLFRVVVFKLTDRNWYLLINLHHLVGDGWSFGVILRDFQSLYQTYLAGEVPHLEPIPFQYADFSEWQRAWFASVDCRREIDYWCQRLANAPELVSFPTDNPRSTKTHFRGATEIHSLSKDLMLEVDRLCTREKVTRFAFTLSAFVFLLKQYSGQSDVVVGTPIANRTRPELESVIGFFINNLALRFHVPEQASFLDLLRSVQNQVLEDLDHQDIPFEKIVETIQPVRSFQHQPLYQVLFSCQKAFIATPQIPDHRLEYVFLDRAGSAMDLWFALVERPNEIRITIEYSSALYLRETVQRIARHFEWILRQTVQNPGIDLQSLATPPPDQRILLTEIWNRTQREYSKSQTVHGLILDQASRTPSKVAVRDDMGVLTYQQLADSSRALAKQLQDHGVNPGNRVGLFFERSIDVVVAILATLRCGATYVPMDPSFPKERLAHMVDDSGMSVILTQQNSSQELPPYTGKVIRVDHSTLLRNTEGGEPITHNGELAYILYTSGSTGKPKGVQILHHSLVNFLYSMRREPGMSPDDVLLAITTLSFDIAELELLLPLVTGASVVIASRQTTLDPLLLRKKLTDSGATVMQATPVTWKMLLESGWEGSPVLKALVGGESVPKELVNRLAPLCGSLWNLYGPTETTIWSTVGQLTAGMDTITIGRPIDNTQIYIVNSELQLQPIGVPGEILIGGDGLSSGYLGLPQLTSEKFLSNPFTSTPGGRVYRTGDMGRWRADGTLECLGRQDHQVKIRGFRIELGDIESALRSHPKVKDATVVAQSDASGEQRLVGYLIPSNGKVDLTDLRRYLGQKIPEYMIPGAWLTLERFPLTPNGKLDRRALPSPQATGNEEAQVPPRTPTEIRLAALWKEVLRSPSVGIHDSFFDLGGHSLLAIKLFSRIEREFGIRLPLSYLIENTTIASLASLLGPQSKEPITSKSLVTIEKGSGKPPFFCVHGAGGNLLIYRDLAKGLGKDVPFYGLQAQGLDGQATPKNSIEEMASHYVREILEAHPTGPYFLGGYCMGGTVAYEMAQQLLHLGKRVGLLVLLDTYNFSTMKQDLQWTDRLSARLQKIRFHGANILMATGQDRLAYLREKVRLAAETATDAILLMKRSTTSDSFRQTLKSIHDINHGAAMVYQPKPYADRLTLIRPQTNYSFFQDPDMGWRPLALGGIDKVDLPINPHAMLVKPYVAYTSKALRTCLEQAWQLTSGSSSTSPKIRHHPESGLPMTRTSDGLYRSQTHCTMSRN